MTKGFVELSGVAYPISPWTAAGGGGEAIWYYHVRVVMENVPRECWNVDGVKLVLGDPCIVERIERSQVSGEDSDLLVAWVWMEDPDELPRSLSYTIFAARTGQAVNITGPQQQPTRIPAHPPDWAGWRQDHLGAPVGV